MHSGRLLTGADTAAAGGGKREHLRVKRSILFGAPSRTQNRAPREGKAVKCNAFDWGRDLCRFSPSVTPYGVPPADGGGLPLSLRDISPNRGISPTPTPTLHFCFSIGTVKTVPYNFSFFIIHYSSIFGSSSYGRAITPLSLRDISPNRGISPTPTHEMNAFTPTNPKLQQTGIPNKILTRI